MTITILNNKIIMTSVATVASLVTNTILAMIIVAVLAAVMATYKMTIADQESTEDVMSRSLAKGLENQTKRNPLPALSRHKIGNISVSNDNDNKIPGVARA